jgi:hypothetical protein
MNLNSFYWILDKIEFNSVFFNHSNNPQRPVFEQLAVALEIFGSYGNAASLFKFACIWAIGEETTLLYLKRVMKALLEIKYQYVKWPNAQERIKISNEFGDMYGFDGCVGLIDGTDVILEKKPMIDGELYFSRKKKYCLNLPLVVDNRKLIRYYKVGYCGSMHDSTVYKDLETYDITWKHRQNVNIKILMSHPSGSDGYLTFFLAISFNGATF